MHLPSGPIPSQCARCTYRSHPRTHTSAPITPLNAPIAPTHRTYMHLPTNPPIALTNAPTNAPIVCTHRIPTPRTHHRPTTVPTTAPIASTTAPIVPTHRTQRTHHRTYQRTHRTHHRTHRTYTSYPSYLHIVPTVPTTAPIVPTHRTHRTHHRTYRTYTSYPPYPPPHHRTHHRTHRTYTSYPSYLHIVPTVPTAAPIVPTHRTHVPTLCTHGPPPTFMTFQKPCFQCSKIWKIFNFVLPIWGNCALALFYHYPGLQHLCQLWAFWIVCSYFVVFGVKFSYSWQICKKNTFDDLNFNFALPFWDWYRDSLLFLNQYQIWNVPWAGPKLKGSNLIFLLPRRLFFLEIEGQYDFRPSLDIFSTCGECLINSIREARAFLKVYVSSRPFKFCVSE